MKRRKSPTRRRGWWPITYGLLLAAYAVFTLLDAFVLPSNLVAVEELTENVDGGSESVNEEKGSTFVEPSITENSYTSDNISITVTTMERHETQIYVAEVVLQDISYLRAGLAGGVFGRNVEDKTSSIAEENNAVLAINGDYYGFRDSGFVLRNGYLYRDTARRGQGNEDLVVYKDGSMEIVGEDQSDASVLADSDALQIFSFGPGLVRDQEITVDAGSEVEQAMRSNPRTAIGMIEPLHYLFVVSDGRSRESAGLTLLELAKLLQDLGCKTAYNLDGGGSSTMWFLGEVVNHPTSGWHSGERRVSDIVYIGE